jgi:hypothetical protein
MLLRRVQRPGEALALPQQLLNCGIGLAASRRASGDRPPPRVQVSDTPRPEPSAETSFHALMDLLGFPLTRFKLLANNFSFARFNAACWNAICELPLTVPRSSLHNSP